MIFSDRGFSLVLFPESELAALQEHDPGNQYGGLFVCRSARLYFPGPLFLQILDKGRAYRPWRIASETNYIQASVLLYS